MASASSYRSAVAVAGDDDLAAQPLDSVDLDCGSPLGHDHDRTDAQQAGGKATAWP